jgi:4'-phosphopantetheinyl transferase
MTSAFSCRPSARARLSCGLSEVHVWRVSLDGLGWAEERLRHFLAGEEMERASRFAAPPDRRRYITRRAALRVILAHYLDTSPAELGFRSDGHGKPRLESEAGPASLRFNVSHSEGLALYSISRGRETGVDVERIRPHLASPWIAKRFFPPDEAARLRRLPEDSYAGAFFVCWTRMEARLKAWGRGLAAATGGGTGDYSALTVHELAPGRGYAGALAVEGHDHRLVFWDLACS